jgi:hypothetical protein
MLRRILYHRSIVLSWRNGNSIALRRIKSRCGFSVRAFVREGAPFVHGDRRGLPPMVCRSVVLPTPFVWLSAPTHLSQRASLLAGHR